MKKLFPVLTLFFVLIIVGLYLLQVKPTNSNKYNDPGTPPIYTPIVPENWVSHTVNNFKLTFFTPALATVSDDNKNLRIYYMGDKQKASGRTQTEIADGFIITVAKVELDKDQTLEQYATLRSEQVKNECPTDAIISDLEEGFVGTETALTFSVRNCRNDHDIYFATMGTTPIEIVLIYMGFTPEDATSYKIIEETIISTFRVL